VEVLVALYATSHDVDAALLERAFSGKPMRQSNGARVVTSDLAGNKAVGSAYRNIWISSTSIDVPEQTVPIAAQLRVHRAIEMRFRSLR
jgi:hypothetical protein